MYQDQEEEDDEEGEDEEEEEDEEDDEKGEEEGNLETDEESSDDDALDGFREIRGKTTQGILTYRKGGNHMKHRTKMLELLRHCGSMVLDPVQSISELFPPTRMSPVRQRIQ